MKEEGRHQLIIMRAGMHRIRLIINSNDFIIVHSPHNVGMMNGAEDLDLVPGQDPLLLRHLVQEDLFDDDQPAVVGTPAEVGNPEGSFD